MKYYRQNEKEKPKKKHKIRYSVLANGRNNNA